MSAEPGLYVLDEPESALSFDSSLMLHHPDVRHA
jgi:predicted ATPase